ncbi:MAG: TolC family protein [Deltaproteobacteria bacterium]|nr:TolC family protein [Deltaproteobacteria bacterium]
MRKTSPTIQSVGDAPAKIFLNFLLIITVASQIIITFLPRAGYGLTLEEAVTRALDNNPELQQQLMNQDLKGERLGKTKSDTFGRIEFLASFNHYNMPRTLAPLTPASISTDPTAVPTTENLFTTGVMYELPLFTGFAQQRSVEIAELEKKMAQVTYKLGREQLIYNVKTIYVNILSQKTQEKAQLQYSKALMNLYKDISLEVELGRKARVELLKAASDLENARVKTRQISGNIKILKAGLAGLLGENTVNSLEDFSMAVSPIDEVSRPDSIRQLKKYHATVLDLEKKDALIEKTTAPYYPQVLFNSFYGQNFGPNDDSNVHEGDWNNQEVWQATINVKWTIFDFGGRKTDRQMAIIQKQQSHREQLKTELELKRSLAEALTRIEMAIDAFQSAETELTLTRETEIIEQTRFDKGAADVNDLLYAKARNQLALSRSIAARYNYITNRFYLDYLLENGESK